MTIQKSCSRLIWEKGRVCWMGHFLTVLHFVLPSTAMSFTVNSKIPHPLAYSRHIREFRNWSSAHTTNEAISGRYGSPKLTQAQYHTRWHTLARGSFHLSDPLLTMSFARLCSTHSRRTLIASTFNLRLFGRTLTSNSELSGSYHNVEASPIPQDAFTGIQLDAKMRHFTGQRPSFRVSSVLPEYIY